MVHSQKNLDAFTSKALMRFYEFIYLNSEKILNNEIRDYIRQISWTLPADFYKYDVLFYLNNKHSSFADIEFTRFVAQNTIILFSKMMTYAIDFNDLQNYEKLGKAIDELAKSDLYVSLDELQEIDFKIKFATEHAYSQKEIDELKNQKRLVQEIKTLQEFTIEHRNELWFALGAWLIYNYGKDKINFDKFREFYDITKNRFTNLQILSKTVIDVINYKTNEIFGWDWWEVLEEGETRYGRWIEFNAFLFYLFEGLKLTETQITKPGTPIVSHPTIERVVRTTNDAFEFIQKDELKWVDKVISSEDWIKAQNFLELNRRALEEQEFTNKKRIIEEKLSEQKIKDFKKEILADFNELVLFRKLFLKYKTLVSLSKSKINASENVQEIYSLNKQCFIGQEKLPFISKSQIGQEVALKENLILSNLISLSKNISSLNSNDQTELINRVLIKIEEFRKIEYIPSVVILSRSIFKPYLLEYIDKFVPAWEIPNKPVPSSHFRGLLNGTSVYINQLREKVLALIIDFRKLGILYCDEPMVNITENVPDSKIVNGKEIDEKLLKVKLQIDDPLHLEIKDENAAIVIKLKNEESQQA